MPLVFLLDDASALAYSLSIGRGHPAYAESARRRLQTMTSTYTLRVTPPSAASWERGGFTTIADALRYAHEYVSVGMATQVITPSGRTLTPSDLRAIGRGEIVDVR